MTRKTRLSDMSGDDTWLTPATAGTVAKVVQAWGPFAGDHSTTYDVTA